MDSDIPPHGHGKDLKICVFIFPCKSITIFNGWDTTESDVEFPNAGAVTFDMRAKATHGLNPFLLTDFGFEAHWNVEIVNGDLTVAPLDAYADGSLGLPGPLNVGGTVDDFLLGVADQYVRHTYY